MNGRVLNEQEIVKIKERYEWDDFDEHAQIVIHDLVATVRDREERMKLLQEKWLREINKVSRIKSSWNTLQELLDGVE